MRNAQHTKKRNLKLLAIVGTILVLALGYFGVAYATQSFWPFSTTPPASNTDTENGINYNPPTDQEVEDSQGAKKNNTQTPDTSGGTTAKRTVSVGIAFADYDTEERAIDVRAFTSDVIEGDGVCTAAFTLDGRTVTATSKAFIDSSSSQCEPILVPESKFEVKGVWKLSVSYSSSKSTGVSPTMDVKVSK